jgi:hypothetical protein
MGLDADIYFRVERYVPKLVLPSSYDVLTFNSAWSGVPRPTHEINACDRYFGPVPVIYGLSDSNWNDDFYPGFWPRICHALVELLSRPEVSDVWYGSCTGEVGMWPVKLSDIQYLTEMYLYTMKRKSKPLER